MSSDLPLREILHPANTPAMGFQAYEMLGGNSRQRDAEQQAFLASAIMNPSLEYDRFDTGQLQRGIESLHVVLDHANLATEPMVRAAVWDSAAYRMAEMYWLLGTQRLITRYPDIDDQQIAAVQSLNEELYGTPDQTVVTQIHSEIWGQINDKEQAGIGVDLREELVHGSGIYAGDTMSIIPAFENPDDQRLALLQPELLNALREKLYADNPDIIALVQDYYQTTVLARSPNEQKFFPSDLFTIFTQVHAMRDPEQRSGVRVVMDEDATALSWDTPTMGVVIGGKREPIEKPETVIAKVFHEYIVHGGRAINGINSSLPVLGTGLFTEADTGEASDYLTFEEGLAGSCEKAVGTEELGAVWKPLDMERYLALGLAYQGHSFRQVFEQLWRTRTLMVAKSGQEPSEKTIATARNNAYTSTVRGFRGTITQLPRVTEEGEQRIWTYNKDLAYLTGKLLLRDYWDAHAEDPQMLDLLFQAKFDPMNHRQLAIVRQTFDQQPG